MNLASIIILLQLVLTLISNPATANNAQIQTLANQAITMATQALATQQTTVQAASSTVSYIVPPTWDACKNINGIQPSIPSGMYGDGNGNCLFTSSSTSTLQNTASSTYACPQYSIAVCGTDGNTYYGNSCLGYGMPSNITVKNQGACIVTTPTPTSNESTTTQSTSTTLLSISTGLNLPASDPNTGYVYDIHQPYPQPFVAGTCQLSVQRNQDSVSATFSAIGGSYQTHGEMFTQTPSDYGSWKFASMPLTSLNSSGNTIIYGVTNGLENFKLAYPDGTVCYASLLPESTSASTPKPIAWWNFNNQNDVTNGLITDQEGTYNAQNVNSVWTSNSDGNSGAVMFEGYIANGLGLNDASAIGFKVNNIPALPQMTLTFQMESNGSTTANGPTYIAVNNSFVISYLNGTFGIGVPGGSLQATVPVDSIYHSYAVTYDGQDTILYMDGQKVGISIANSPGTITAGQWDFGYIPSGYGGVTNKVTVDNVKIYNQALNSIQIQSLN